MRTGVKSTEPTAEQLEFRFVSGHRALDLVTTLGDRYRVGIERLRQPEDLDRWLGSAGLPAATPAAAHDLRDARRLREVIYRLAHAALYTEPLDTQDIAELNAWAARPRLAPQLDRDLRRDWVSPHPVRGALAVIACEAIELLTGSERELIRECAAAPACSLLYIDRSRGQRRRWCEMGRCGSRAKMAQYRKRQTEDSDVRRAGR